MSYKTLYRTYRPQQFKDVVGQEHITKTFKNALSKDKISHAYLFTGPRGTGKTTVAKIIAKAANCEEAPISEPCNECSSCKSINSGFDSDIFEIDAASNNGVDEIREIRDKVKYAPTAGRFKVYIIDEVHMLSTGAFNALLKTLEEPPKHAIFILATTEPHKIPATIISRCQRFDFRSISIKDIIYRTKQIVNLENINIEEQAIITIAKNAQGGMRDALSLLDQAISYSEHLVTEEDVHEITGTVSEEKLAKIIKMLLKNRPQYVIEFIDELISSGKEPLRLVENLIYYFRDLFLLKKLNTIDTDLIINHSEETIDISNQLDVSKIYQIISLLNDIQYEMRKTNTPRVFIELAIFDMVHYFDVISNHEENKKDNNKKDTVKINQSELIEQEVNTHTEVNQDVTKEEIQDTSVPIENENKYEEKIIDVKIIEYILNHASKEKKLALMLEWQSIYGTDINNATVEQILIDGQIEAISTDNQMILSYDHESICAKLYETKVYEKATELLYQVFKEKFILVPIPRIIWEEKREEFVEQFKNKVMYPKLSPITKPIMIRKSDSNYDHEPEFVKEVISLFGEEVVEIK